MTDPGGSLRARAARNGDIARAGYRELAARPRDRPPREGSGQQASGSVPGRAGGRAARDRGALGARLHSAGARRPRPSAGRAGPDGHDARSIDNGLSQRLGPAYALTAYVIADPRLSPVDFTAFASSLLAAARRALPRARARHDREQPLPGDGQRGAGRQQPARPPRACRRDLAGRAGRAVRRRRADRAAAGRRARRAAADLPAVPGQRPRADAAAGGSRWSGSTRRTRCPTRARSRSRPGCAGRCRRRVDRRRQRRLGRRPRPSSTTTPRSSTCPCRAGPGSWPRCRSPAGPARPRARGSSASPGRSRSGCSPA